jgi:hypothetical protein
MLSIPPWWARLVRSAVLTPIFGASAFALDAVVSFNELMYHPRDGEVEWVEVHNMMTVDVDLSEWRLSGGVDFEFPTGTVIPGGGYLVIEGAGGGIGAPLGPFSGSLNNSGERIRLRNNSDRVMDEIDYGDSGRWPVAADGAGATLAKRSPRLASGLPENWTFSRAAGGSRGTENSGDSTAHLLEFDSTWRYNESGITPAAGWEDSAHAVGADGWQEDPGVLAAELNALPLPITTNLTLPGLNDPFVITYYFETEFTLTAAQLANLQQLNLRHLIDDGAVFYLNGEEVLRYKMDDGPVIPSTTANAGNEAVLAGPVSLPFDDAVAGSNRFSIEVHQASDTSSDIVFGLELEALITGAVAGTSDLLISEVSAGNAPVFWIELHNTGAIPIELSDYTLENPVMPGGGSHSLDAGLLSAGARLLIDENTLGFRVSDEDPLFLKSTNGDAVFDAVRVKNRTLARREDSTPEDRFLTPTVPTPGTDNTFAIEDAIVINEIMYHHRSQPKREAQAAGLTPEVISDWNDSWRYNQSGTDQGIDWSQSAHPVGGAWFSGSGLLGFDLGGNFPQPILTNLTWPALNNPYVVTYYFEREINLTQDQVDRLEEVEFGHFIDDGAVFYVNGVEVGRFCMPGGAIDSTTLATCPATNDATLQVPLVIPNSAFAVGANRISIEVHQAEIGNADVIFGLEVTALLVDAGGSPSQEYAEIGEEWIEIYHRGTEPVDLTGWSVDGTIAFQFPDNTTISPGDHLVIARDAAALAAKHPGITIAGEFSGRLNNNDGYLKLEDAAQNPVDELHYYDGGRWPDAADGDGSSLELRDPDADNSVAESWAASNENDQSTWQTFVHRARAQRFPGTNDPSTYHELIFGLLDAGEFLIDDISVIEDPDGTARELIQNGDFEDDPTGTTPDHWRMVGTHGAYGRSVVINDPDAGGKVLHVVATGAMWHQQNQAETTLKFGNSFVTINSARDYEISFRAKWLTGNPHLNTRLYFDRVAKTHVLAQPATSGTPGAANSSQVTNLGPTTQSFAHSPLRPASGEAVTVRGRIADPDGVASATLHWSTNGISYNQVPMSAAGNGLYEGEIPGQASNAKVQFYLEALDDLGATSTFPASGRSSRALYRVGSESNGGHPAQHLEIVMLASDEAALGTFTNLMSNYRWGGTLIYEDEAFYDVGIRLKGSQRGRPDLNRRGFNISFNAEQKFRGVLNSIGLDRSGGWKFGRTFGQDEILIWHYLNRAGGIPALHNDIVFLDAPGVNDGSAQLQLARFSNEFLESQYPNGDEGSLHNYELIYYPTTTTGGVEGLKRPNPDNVVGVPVRDLGDNNEAWRYYFQLRNNQVKDDFGGIKNLGQLFSMSSAAMNANADTVIDVDQWLRCFAGVSLAAVGDSYFNNGNAHNARFYHRPSDGRMLLFPWDMDFAFVSGETSSMTPNSDLVRLLQDPVHRRLYWGHVNDIVRTSYSSGYMNFWVNHYQSFLTGQSNITSLTNFIQQRASFALQQVRNAVPPVGFSITTNGGNAFNSAVTPVQLAGNGWITVREIRLAGSNATLPLTWTDENSWQVEVPLGSGLNVITLEAIAFDGSVITTATIDVTNTSTVVAASPANFVLTELMYNPLDPSTAEIAAGFVDKDQFEFVEFQNINVGPVDAGGVTFDSGIEFSIPPGTHLAPGQRIVIVANAAAFQERYAIAFPSATVVGNYQSSGTAFRNQGERVHVLSADGQSLADFTYSDSAPWSASADGDGYSLVPIAPWDSNFDPALPQNWRSSSALGGDPGETDEISFAAWSATHGNVGALDDPEQDHLVALLEYTTGRSPQVADSQPAIRFDPTDLASFSITIAIGADDTIIVAESSHDLLTWDSSNILYTGSSNNGDGSRNVLFRQTAPVPAQFVRFGMTLRD